MSDGLEIVESKKNESDTQPIRKNLTFIRHAESMHNAHTNYPNLKDHEFVNTKLSENGIKQANKISGQCDLLIVSPMKRTLETYVHSQLKVKRLIFDRWSNSRIYDLWISIVV